METKNLIATMPRFKKSAVVILLLVFSLRTVQAQLRGTITDIQTGKKLSGITVLNTTGNSGTSSGSEGSFLIKAEPGDSIIFSGLGYKRLAISAGISRNDTTIVLTPQAFELEQITVNRHLTPYQKDSLERRAVFGKKVDQRQTKVKMIVMPLGIGINGGITALAEKISRKHRRLKKFQKRFRETEKELYATSRYTPGLISNVTSLKDPELTEFMQQYPVAPDFALAANDAEMKMWILYNYREWCKQLKRKQDSEEK